MVQEEGDSRISAPIILFVEFSVALVLAVYLLYKYGNIRKQNPFVTGCTLLVWFLSFVSIFLLPVDVSSVSAAIFRFSCIGSDQQLQNVFISNSIKTTDNIKLSHPLAQGCLYMTQNRVV